MSALDKKVFEDKDGDRITVYRAVLAEGSAHIETNDAFGFYADRDTAPELAIAILRATGWTGELVLDDGPRIGL